MATKTAKKKTAAKSAKPKARVATEKVETAKTESANNVESIVKRIQAGFQDAGAALRESGSIADEKRREILLTLIENAQVNADATFAALKEVMEAESLGESLRIQRDALREGIERNVAQVRDVASLAAQSSRESLEPVTGYFASLRDKVRSGARA